MQWTKDRPTADGYYWFRIEPRWPASVVRVFDERQYLFGGTVYGLRLVRGEWWGPLTPPPENEAGSVSRHTKLTSA